jgi:murein DD-endopeptidase MepM/ murein hydrolase activator NlpD
MSQSSKSGQHHARHPGHHHGASHAAKAAREAPGPGRRRDYTIAHAGRQFRFGPLAFWTAVSAVLIMALWSAGTATYFAFRDDLLTRLLARQADMQYAYEDRITDLRAQVDRLTSRQLLDQEQVEQRIEQMVRRQATLESRTTTLSGLPDTAPTATIRTPGRAGPRADAAPAGNGKAGPANDTHSALEGRGGRNRAVAQKSKGVETTLAKLQESLDRVETRQVATLAAMEETYDAKARRLRGVLTELGVNLGKSAAVALPSAMGGPFIPVSMRPEANGFDRALQRVQLARVQVERLSKTMIAVPVRQPLAGELDMTSGFGVRSDPFTRGAAMHSGLDFRGPTGEPVRATAAGTVSSAGVNGGYGRVVEIDHENGFSTRYGHLSEILVSEGATVRPGQVIGRLGSTGRSTGPHLHYETRIDGDAVDPNKFLRAGLRLDEKS